MKNRIIYIDQLKTLAIFGVVCEHVSNISMGINGRVFWLFFLITMPMFFFSSGMFVKKKDTMIVQGECRAKLVLTMPNRSQSWASPSKRQKTPKRWSSEWRG